MNIYNLNNNEIDLSTKNIYVLLLNFSMLNYQDYMTYLSDDEIQRVDNINNKIKKNQFVISRAIVKKLLSKYLSKIPNQIEFSYNKHGKPFVPEKYNNHSLEFNISHSDIYGLIAITLYYKIGVDIQRVNHDINIDSLSERFFSEDEKEQLMKFDKNKRADVFHNCWVKKESFIKAIGSGVAYGLDNFSVSLEENHRNYVLDLKNKKWYCYKLIEFENYKTALTMETKSNIFLSYKENYISNILH